MAGPGGEPVVEDGRHLAFYVLRHLAHRMDRMETKQHRKQAGGVVEQGLHGVHGGAGPGGGVVRLVVQAVNLQQEGGN